MEIPFFPDLVFKETPVRLLHPLGKIAEKYKSGDYRLFQHGHILYLHKLTLVAWRGSYRYLFKHISVELRSGYDASPVVIYLYSCLQHLIYSLLCYRGSEEDREISERREPLSYRVFKILLGCYRLVGDEVPFVDADHQTLLVFLNQAENISVLAFYSTCCIDHKDTDVACLNRPDRANHAIIFDIFVYLLLFSYAGSVYKVEIKSEFVVSVID